MRKKIRQLCIGILFLLLPVQCSVSAEVWGDVYDDAGLLTTEEGTAVNDEITTLKEKTGWNIYAVTTEDAGGKTSVEYADDFFDEHSTEAEDGVALLIDMDNREIYLSTCGKAIRYLTDTRIDSILDDAYNEVSEEKYAECFNAMLNGIEKYYDQGIPDGQYNYDTETGEVSVYHSLTMGEILVAVVLAVIVFLCVYFGVIGTYRLKFNKYQYDFRKFGEVTLDDKKDLLVNSTVTHRHIPKNDGGGSSSSSHSSSRQSSTHHSSSGRSHGGSGRKF